ncbi:MAG: FkbM family methyltransferase [Rhodobacteraceae bacterium]|nr:MAG: FkbM family methyltransferase [Paracoccaceae bacterium]
MLLDWVRSSGRAYYRARGHFPATIRGTEYKLDPYHFAFWRAAAQERWEPGTLDAITTYLTPESTYVDIGAWIGPTVLHAARRCARVYCFEPDPTALRFLNWNLDLNGLHNVHSFGLALAAEPGLCRMATFGDNPGDSQTSLLQTEAEHFVEVLAITWADFLAKARPENVTLIKMDVEGAEFDLVPTMCAYLEAERPALLLSTHGPYLDADKRKAAMAGLSEALAFYPNVFDENLASIDRAELLSDAAAEGFGTYLFTD